MKGSSHRPDLSSILAGLKDFQLDTAEYVFRRMYTDPDYTRRFLIADEVGLGKTIVAKGLIGKAVDYLWEAIPRIDIVYICSNSDNSQGRSLRVSHPNNLNAHSGRRSKKQKIELCFIHAGHFV